jgi:hypothetical protein
MDMDWSRMITMDQLDYIPTEADYIEIAGQIGKHISNLLPSPPPEKIELSSTLKVWRTDANFICQGRLSPGYSRICECAINTHYYHHQITFDGIPSAYARTLLTLDKYRNARWEFRELSVTELALNIHKTYNVLHEITNTTVNLLLVPTHKILALWTQDTQSGGEYVGIARKPHPSDLESLKIVTAKQFFSFLVETEMSAGIEDKGHLYGKYDNE